MKKLLIIVAAIGFLAVRASAHGADPFLRIIITAFNNHKISGVSSAVPNNGYLTNQDLKNFNYQTRAEFYADFGYIPITRWEYSDDFDKISFLKNNVEYTAYYDLDSKLVGTISKATEADLPGKAMEKINKWYKGYTVGDIIFFDDNELNESDMIYYSRRFDNEDKYFVELENGKDRIVVQVNSAGDPSYFAAL